jgi:hypothetical protein
MKKEEILNEYISLDATEFKLADKNTRRRPKLTLRHLSKLRKVRELKRVEKGQRAKDIPSIYNSPSQGGPSL